MQILVQDIRYGIRMLFKTRLVTVVAVITLAVGIGATSAMFQFVDAGLVQAVSYREPDRLVHIAMTKQAEFSEMEASYPNFLDWQKMNTSFEALAGYAQNRLLFRQGTSEPAPVVAATVSTNFFQTLGVSNELGGTFADNQSIIISYACWKNRFEGRRDVVGQAARLGDNTYTIAGVLPRWFEFGPLGAAEMFVLPPQSGPVIRNPQRSLAESGRSAVGSHSRLRSALVVAEIAIAAALLMVSGLLLRTVSRIVNADPGFNRHNLLLLTYVLPASSYRDAAAARNFRMEMERRVSALPGVTGVAEISTLPLSDCNGCNTNRFAIEGKPNPVGAAQPEAAARGASLDYFQVLQARLLKGRVFGPQDFAANAAPVIVVNRALQDEYFNGDAVGKRLTFTFAAGQPPREVVGVVDNIKEGFLDSTARSALYMPLDGNINANILIRTAVDASSAGGMVRNAILEIEQNAALFGMMTMDTRVANSTTMFLRNLPAILMTSFGFIALLLAAIGIYGVVSYSVEQRTREFGMRMALGASSKDLFGLVLGAVLRLAFIGIAIGVPCAALASKAAASLFFEIRAADFAGFAIVPFMIVAIAIIASLIPAQRAARLDPMEALRYE